ncbi:hypothetical protein H5410_031150, partial [Solanum commersonii]
VLDDQVTWVLDDQSATKEFISKEDHNDIFEEEKHLAELTDDAHAIQLIETFGSTFLMQKLTVEQGLSPKGTPIILIWIARGIRALGALEKPKALKQIHKILIFAILEPFSYNTHIYLFTNYLTVHKSICNDNGKILVFWNNDIDGVLLNLDDQNKSTTTSPWCTIGDFNVITTPEENLGGVPYRLRKWYEFLHIIEKRGLIDLVQCERFE